MSYYENALKLRPFIEKGSQSLTDTEALQAKALYPKWSPGNDYEAGYRLTYGDDLYRVLQAHTSQDDWQPGPGTESLYTRIDDSHAGTFDDPIPYDGNMALERGKYYSQGGVIYLCIRDTVNPVYHALHDLVGLYVEVAG